MYCTAHGFTATIELELNAKCFYSSRCLTVFLSDNVFDALERSAVVKLKIVVKFIIIFSVVSLKARYIPQSTPPFFCF